MAKHTLSEQLLTIETATVYAQDLMRILDVAPDEMPLGVCDFNRIATVVKHKFELDYVRLNHWSIHIEFEGVLFECDFGKEGDE